MGAVGGRNFGLPIDLATLLIQQLVATAQAMILHIYWLKEVMQRLENVYAYGLFQGLLSSQT